MARTRQQVKKEPANHHVSANVTNKPSDPKPINKNNVEAGSGKKRLLRNQRNVNNDAGSSSQLKEAAKSINVEILSSNTKKLKRSSALSINDSDSEYGGPSTPKKAKFARTQDPKNSINSARRGSGVVKNTKRSRVPSTDSDGSEYVGPSKSKKSKVARRGSGVVKNTKRSRVPSTDSDGSEGSGAPKTSKRKGTQSKQNTPQKKSRKNRSKAWFHFNVVLLTVDCIEGKYAACKYCDKKYKVSQKTQSSTGNLRRHLVKHHPDKWGNEDGPPPVFTQENFRESLLKWMVLSSQPFAVVEGDAFIDLIKLLNPTATVVSNKTIRADLMQAYHSKVEDIADLLKGVPGKISVTLDIWTSKNVIPFLVIRAHWITAEWEYKTELLDFAYIPGDHSGKNQCRIFLKCMRRFGIPLSKILAFTMDNATSNGTFITCLQAHGIEIGLPISAVDNQVRCLAHILNLAVQDMLKSLNTPYMEAEPTEEEEAMDDLEDDDDDLEDSDVEEGHEEGTSEDEGLEEETSEDEEDEEEEVQEPVGGKPRSPTAKLRKLIRKIRKSTKLRQKLKRLCRFYKIKPLVPIIDVSTRWNSTFNMIKRAKHLRVPLTALCLNNKALSSLGLSDDDWDQLKNIEELLQKFDRATQLISMERHETFCSYIPTLNWLLDVLTEYTSNEESPLADAAHAGLTKLLKYALNVNNHKLPFVALILNPALKMNYFTEHKYNPRTITEIKKRVSDYFTENYETSCDTEVVAEPIEDELYAHMYHRSMPATDVSREFEKYLTYPLSPPKVTDTLAFWKAQATDLPCLSRMARDFLAIQTTSVAVERDNSAGADLVTPSRCSLHAKTIQASMCMKRWFASEVVVDSTPQ